MSEAALEGLPAPAPEERDLVERARAGDHGAYATLVREHEQAAFRVAYVLLGSAADAEDVAQEAFVKAYRALGRFRAGSPFRPWLLRIVGNEARNHRRAAGRRSVPSGSGARARAGAERVSRRTTSSSGARAARHLLAAVDALAEGERTAILARYVIGLTDEETAAALGVPRATVKMRAWRGLKKLRRELGEEAS